MPALEQVQQAMIRAIDHGPAFLPQGLFAGPPDRALRGLRVHANTISHARLVALEETFPRSRERLGHARFNQISRCYADLPEGRSQPLARIGAGFAAFLARSEGLAEAAALARFEWLWLESYHAAEAAPLYLADLAGIAADRLTDLRVAAHPAAFCAPCGPAVQAALAEEAPGLADAAALLITRPDAEVLIHPASPAMGRMLRAAGGPTRLGNLLAAGDEPDGSTEPAPDAAMQAALALLAAGALRKAE